MLQSVLGRVGAAYSNTKVNSSLQILKEHQTPGHKSTSSLRPTAPIHGGDPHGGAGAAHPVPSHHRLVQGSSEVFSYHHQDQALAGIGVLGGAGSSHQRFKNLKRTTFSSDINEITSSTKCNILNVGPVPVQYLFLYPGLHQKNILHGFCCLEKMQTWFALHASSTVLK